MRLLLETLEGRDLPAVQPIPVGDPSLVRTTEVNVSHNPLTLESEMAVAVNPANPLEVVGFTHEALLFNVIQVFYSRDGGFHWALTQLGGTGAVNNDGQGVGIRFDPTVKFTSAGDLFVAYGVYSGATTKLVVGKSTDGGATFADGAFRVVDTQSTYGGVDKFLLGVGPSGPGSSTPAVYVAYERNDGGQPIVVSGSNDGGNTFTTPYVLDTYGRGSYFAGPAVGPNGELYVVWQSSGDSRIKLREKPDGLWGPQPWGPTQTVRNLHTSLSQFRLPATSRRGVYNNPSIDVDRSGGPHNGRVYVAFTDQVSGNNTDIFLTYSDDHGNSWSPLGPTGNVSSSPGTEFHSWVAVDQVFGTVDVLYRTTAGDPLNVSVVTQVAASFDGGRTFPAAVTLSSARSLATAVGVASEYLDYDGLDVLGGVIHGFWSDNRGPLGTYLTDLDAYYGQAAVVGGSPHTGAGAYELTVGGDAKDQPGGVITIGRSPLNPAYLVVTVNGRTEFAGLRDSVSAIRVDARSGDNKVSLDSSLGPLPPVSVLGGGGDNTLVGPDLKSLWTITGRNSGTLTATGLNVTFTSVQNLRGGRSADVFQFNDSAAGVTGAIDGGGGSNTLDYARSSAAVIVSLRTGSATGARAVAHFKNVVGGAGGGGFNVLVGDGGDILTGGNGRRNLLIAGPRASTLVGGDEGDILIAGTTPWDSDPEALRAVMAEWTRTAEGYADRVAHLLNGGGLNGRYVLNPGVLAGHGGGNHLTGHGGFDLYFAAPELDVYTRNNAEIFIALGSIAHDRDRP